MENVKHYFTFGAESSLFYLSVKGLFTRLHFVESGTATQAAQPLTNRIFSDDFSILLSKISLCNKLKVVTR